MDYEICLLCSFDNWPWKAGALKMASGGVVPKVVHFGVLRRLVLKLEAIFQNFISLSIQGVRRSFFAQIEAEIKEIPHKS